MDIFLGVEFIGSWSLVIFSGSDKRFPMTDVLSDPLVKKYFGACEHGDSLTSTCLCRLSYAGKVLASMQEPIRKGDSILIWMESGIIESRALYDIGEYHPLNLRLPNRFQGAWKPEKRECDCTQGKCRHGNIISGGSQIDQPAPAPEKCGCMFTSAISCSGRASEPCHCKCHPFNQPAKTGGCGSKTHGLETHSCDSDTAVEAKIKFIASCSWGNDEKIVLEKKLRELVALARRAK